MSDLFSLPAARDHYAEPVLARIRAQARKAPGQVSTALSFIERHLFDRDLFTAIKTRFARTSPYPLKSLFTQAVRSPLGRYLHDCRMQVVASLLEHTDHLCYEIGIAVGYGEKAAFYKAFAAWPGSGRRTPAEWRAHLRGAQPSQPPEDKPATPNEARLTGWRRALLLPWTLGEEAAADPVAALHQLPGVDMMVHLMTHYPGVADRCRRLLGKRPTGEVIAGDDPFQVMTRLAFESFKAKRLQGALAAAPSPLDAACLRAGSPMKSYVHYHVLSRAGGAVEARASLEPCHPSVVELLPSYRAEAALRVAREVLAAGDFHTAELELGVAEMQLTAAGPVADPATSPGILATRAELLYRQGRCPQAAVAAGRAADAYRRLGRTELAAEAVLLREAAFGRGGAGESVAELESALAAIDEAAQPNLAVRLLSALAGAYASQRRQDKTEAVFARLAALRTTGEMKR